MPRPATGQIIEKSTHRGTTFALRFRAYGQRRYITLGADAEGWTRARADQELAYVLAQVQRGVWQPPAAPAAVDLPPEARTFHVFASEWWAAKKLEVSTNTVKAYEF